MKKLSVVMTVVLSSLCAVLAVPTQADVAPSKTTTNHVFVSGAVRNPGVYEIKSTDGVFELIAQAGGATSAVVSKVVVKRGATTMTVDVLESLRAGIAAPNLKLHNGDFVIVRKNDARILVMGEVKNPGSYNLPENGKISVVEAIALAGGFRADREVENITIIRKMANGKATTRILPADLADPKLKEQLQKDDVVNVTKAVDSTPRQAPLDGYFWFLSLGTH